MATIPGAVQTLIIRMRVELMVSGTSGCEGIFAEVHLSSTCLHMRRQSREHEGN